MSSQNLKGFHTSQKLKKHTCPVAKVFIMFGNIPGMAGAAPVTGPVNKIKLYYSIQYFK